MYVHMCAYVYIPTHTHTHTYTHTHTHKGEIPVFTLTLQCTLPTRGCLYVATYRCWPTYIYGRHIYVPTLGYIYICGLNMCMWNTYMYVGYIYICGLNICMWNTYMYVEYIYVCGLHICSYNHTYTDYIYIYTCAYMYPPLHN